MQHYLLATSWLICNRFHALECGRLAVGYSMKGAVGHGIGRRRVPVRWGGGIRSSMGASTLSKGVWGRHGARLRWAAPCPSGGWLPGRLPLAEGAGLRSD
jgi:hypothetical protein